MKDTLCPGCQQPMLPKGKLKKPDEYDHAQGCPLDPRNPANYPSNSGNELQEIINHCQVHAEHFKAYSAGTLRASHAVDVYVTIMRLAAYMQGLEGKI